MKEIDKYNIPLGTLYDFNKKAVLKDGEITTENLSKVKEELKEWFNWQIDSYAMLLCRERYDFTVFHLYEGQNQRPPEIAVTELIELLRERGKILSIEKDSNVMNDAWEIWIEIDEDAYVYYLFNCEDWVIQC